MGVADAGCQGCPHASPGYPLGFCGHIAVFDFDMAETGKTPAEATPEGIDLGRRIRGWLDSQVRYDAPGCPGRAEDEEIEAFIAAREGWLSTTGGS